MQTETRTPQDHGSDSERASEHGPEQHIEWVTPDFEEQLACAEICAYVFHT